MHYSKFIPCLDCRYGYYCSKKKYLENVEKELNISLLALRKCSDYYPRNTGFYKLENKELKEYKDILKFLIDIEKSEDDLVSKNNNNFKINCYINSQAAFNLHIDMMISGMMWYAEGNTAKLLDEGIDIDTGGNTIVTLWDIRLLNGDSFLAQHDVGKVYFEKDNETGKFIKHIVKY